MIAVGDPVEAGLAIAFDRPGGNVTGMSDFREDFPEKRLTLVRELVPTVSRVGFIYNPAAPTAKLTLDVANDATQEVVSVVR
jgi:putative ABC transport system substrate-binding protein